MTWTTWKRGNDTLFAFANWRNTFKPSAVDFGLDIQPAILKPETANSYEAGLKSELFGRALRLEVAGYFMDFDNLMVAQAIGGLPALANAGSSRFKGVELSASWQGSSPDSSPGVPTPGRTPASGTTSPSSTACPPRSAASASRCPRTVSAPSRCRGRRRTASSPRGS